MLYIRIPSIMKRILIIILALLIVSPLAFAEKRAFLVGISKYKTEWRDIHGSEDVALLSRELINQDFQVTIVTNEQATRNGIINGLKAFIKKIKKGDIVYIHFSTHGQPVEDGLNGRAHEEADGWDEAIVPYDAGSRYVKNGYDGSKHITDDELNGYVSQIRTMIGPKGALYVVMDACHAGNMSRGNGTPRGTNEGLSRSGKKYSFANAEHKHHYRLANDAKLAPTLFLEACTSKERNTEIFVKGKEYGSLSYMVYLTLSDKKKGKIGAKPDTFERAVRWYTTTGSKFWPKNQTLVSETSY